MTTRILNTIDRIRKKIAGPTSRPSRHLAEAIEQMKPVARGDLYDLLFQVDQDLDDREAQLDRAQRGL